MDFLLIRGPEAAESRSLAFENTLQVLLIHLLESFSNNACKMMGFLHHLNACYLVL